MSSRHLWFPTSTLLQELDLPLPGGLDVPVGCTPVLCSPSSDPLCSSTEGLLPSPPPASWGAGGPQEHSPARVDGEVLPHVFHQLGGPVVPQAARSPRLRRPGQPLVPHLARRKGKGQAGISGAQKREEEKPTPLGSGGVFLSTHGCPKKYDSRIGLGKACRERGSMSRSDEPPQLPTTAPGHGERLLPGQSTSALKRCKPRGCDSLWE